MTDGSTMLFTRHEDLQLIRDFVESRSYYQCILNLYAISGVGKTIFLRTIQHNYQEQLSTSFISIDEFSDPNFIYRLDQLVTRIISDLQGTSPVASSETAQITDLADALVNLIKELANRDRVTLLIFDDYDKMPAHPRAVFEDIVLSRIVKLPTRTPIILSSQQKLQFVDRLDLRVRIEDRELSRITAENIRQSIPEYTDLAPEIKTWTGGMPYLVQTFVARVRDHHINNIKDYQAHRSELLDEHYLHEVRTVVLGRTAEEQKIDDKAIEKLLDILALVRRFDIGLLKILAPRLDPDAFSHYTQKDYLEVIRRLGSRVSWRLEGGGYTLDEMLKAMMSNYIRVFEEETFQKIHQTIVEVYRETLSTKYNQSHFVEMFYHLLLLERHKGKDDNHIARFITDKIVDHLNKLRSSEFRDVAELDSLRQRLMHDPDLKPFLGDSVFTAIDEMM
jgi:hypothetical protein